MINCSVCEKQLELESKNNFGIKVGDNEYMCLPCKDIADFVNEDKPKPKIKTVSNPVVKEKVKTISTYQCFMCKKTFTGMECSCGYKNPLYLKRKKGKKKKK